MNRLNSASSLRPHPPHLPSSVRGPSSSKSSKHFPLFSKMPSVGFFLFLWLMAVPFGNGLKCLDCSGRNCMGNFCEGDYCLMSHYAPRWGTMVWGEPTVVKGCLSGRMLRRGVRSHCETADEVGKEPFTCFCDGKDYCNQQHGKTQRTEMEPVQLYTCICEGVHCRDKKTCTGELCTYVINHRSNERERGCVNASVPLLERRSAGSCMVPPITGAMHHTVAKRAVDLQKTESCICEGDFCNKEKPEPVPKTEKMRCRVFAQVELMGQKMMSKNSTCTGEFCFRAEIKSKLGHMSAYRTMGCASFSRDSQLAEELEPTGCAKFDSEDVQVNVCFKTDDEEAIERAKESRQRGGRRMGRKKQKNGRAKGRGTEEREGNEEEETVEKEEAAEEEEERGNGRKGKTAEGAREQGGEEGSRRSELTGESGEEEENRREAEEEEGERQRQTDAEKGDDGETEQQHFIFERPTLAPAVTESSNTTLISVFLLLILLILLSGAVWKLQLHKRLFRASYDTVAGG